MAAAVTNPFIIPNGGKVISVESVEELVKIHVHQDVVEVVLSCYIKPQEIM